MSKKPRACVYARYSTDKQRAESIEDQFTQCEKTATREGFEVVAKFSDKELSGGTADRPGYQAMLTAARAHRFDVLVCEDISRLTRNRAEFGPRSAELEDLGVHLVTCVGDDTRRDGWGLTIQIKMAMGEHARREASYRTRRGLEGKALKGEDAGGRAYGYTPGAQHPSGKRSINPEQAAIVEKIFTWRAEGWSAQRIARKLNEDGVPSPGASWKRTATGATRKTQGGWRPSAIAGDHRTGNGILNNPLYKGVQIWSRTKWTRSAADSNNRKVSEVDGKSWIRADVPHLRIVSDELWEKVRVIQTMRNARRDAVRKGVARRTGCDSAYWLGGIVVCDVCGSNFIGDSRHDYVCPSFTAGACTNGMRFRRDKVHQEVWTAVRSHLLCDESIEAVRVEVEAALHERARQEQKSQRLAESGDGVKLLDAELAKLRTMGLRPAALAAAVAEVEAERAELIKRATVKADPAEGRAKKLLTRLPAIIDAYRRQVKKALTPIPATADVHTARATMRQLLVDGQIRLKPTASKDGVCGTVGLVRLSDYVLEMSGMLRKSRDYPVASRIGSGGRI